MMAATVMLARRAGRRKGNDHENSAQKQHAISVLFDIGEKVWDGHACSKLLGFLKILGNAWLTVFADISASSWRSLGIWSLPL